jgi:hypothetical protein
MAGSADHHHGDLPVKHGGSRCLDQVHPGSPIAPLGWTTTGPAVIDGTMIRLQVDHLSGDRDPDPA